MNDTIEIYGSNITFPQKPKDEDALNFGLPRGKQKWQRIPLPDFFNKVE